MFRIIKHVSNDDYPSSYLVTKYVYCLVSKVTADSEAVCYCTFMFILRLRCNWCCCGLVTKLYPTLLDYMDWSPPGSPVHEISQARILEWVAIFFFSRSSQPRDRTWVSYISGRQSLTSLHWKASSLPRGPPGKLAPNFTFFWRKRKARSPRVSECIEYTFNKQKN